MLGPVRCACGGTPRRGDELATRLLGAATRRPPTARLFIRRLRKMACQHGERQVVVGQPTAGWRAMRGARLVLRLELHVTDDEGAHVGEVLRHLGRLRRRLIRLTLHLALHHTEGRLQGAHLDLWVGGARGVRE